MVAPGWANLTQRVANSLKKSSNFALVKVFKLSYMVIAAVVGLLLCACANIGSPEGGPMDYTPPRFVKSSPAQGAINVKGNKVEITFDEIVVLKDQQKKIAVSPVQKNPPLIKALGKKVTIEFRDDMLPNTTYCVDFSNAIEDNNEGNPLDGFSFAFSTGEEVDSLQISGLLLRARDLEPMKHTMVGVHSNLDDSAFTCLPLERLCRTNDRGQFTLRNLKPGRYHLFALNDMDGNHRMARTEDYAFIDDIIVPAASRYESMDTVFTFDNKIDTVKAATHTLFTPNDVLLTMFNENYRSLYLKQTSRPTPSRLHVLFSAPSPEMPTLRLLKPEQHPQDWCVVERSSRNDSIFYWLTDSAMIKCDTITVAMDYLRTGDNDSLTTKTDTIHFAYRKSGTLLKQEAQEKKEREQMAKRVASLRDKQAKGKELDDEELKFLKEAETPKVPRLEINIPHQGTIEIFDTISLTFQSPIASIDPKGVHLEMKRDTLWIEQHDVSPFTMKSDGDVLNYILPMEFEPDSAYRLTIDSLAITSIYGIHNNPLTCEFKIKGVEQYGNITLRVNVADHAFIELLDSKDEIVRTMPVNAGTAFFENLPPATYYARLVLDDNNNGKWDTGNHAQHLQPEEVYYFPKRLKVRKNWDLEETWDIYAAAVDMQKPEEIIKNRPDDNKNKFAAKNNAKKKKKGSNTDDDDDEFDTGAFRNNTYSGNKYQDYQNNNRRR